MPRSGRRTLKSRQRISSGNRSIKRRSARVLRRIPLIHTRIPMLLKSPLSSHGVDWSLTRGKPARRFGLISGFLMRGWGFTSGVLRKYMLREIQYSLAAILITLWSIIMLALALVSLLLVGSFSGFLTSYLDLFTKLHLATP